MTRVVVDTNVLASGFLSRKSTPGTIFNAWDDGKFDLLVSSHILTELGRTLAKPFFRNALPSN